MARAGPGAMTRRYLNNILIRAIFISDGKITAYRLNYISSIIHKFAGIISITKSFITDMIGQ